MYIRFIGKQLIEWNYAIVNEVIKYYTGMCAIMILVKMTRSEGASLFC